MPPKVRDERLAWLAVEPTLKRRANRIRPIDAVGLFLTVGMLSHRRRNRPRSRLQVYSVAVDHACGWLDETERATLRTERTVPPWFLPEVERVARAVRKEQPLPTTRT